MSAPLRVLCLDHEGGHGGSSRSLHELLSHIPRNRITPTVWFRRAGIVEGRYAALQIPCRHEPSLAGCNSRPTLKSNVRAYSANLYALWRNRSHLAALAVEIAREFDVVHFNHDGLWLLARWLRPRLQLPFTFHIRTNVPDSPFATLQARKIGRMAEQIIFITENEQQTFIRRGVPADKGIVILNPVTLRCDVERHPAVPANDRLIVACVSNFDYIRGQDRLIEIAAALKAAGCEDVLFVVAGDYALRGKLPGMLGEIAQRHGTLADYATARGVGHMFNFLGHVTEPETVLVCSDLIIRPSREYNPWGRDVIEALSLGKPVLTFGTWSTFVSNDETGILMPEFDAKAVAQVLGRFAENRAALLPMGDAGRQRVRRLCNPVERAAELARAWSDVAYNG